MRAKTFQRIHIFSFVLIHQEGDEKNKHDINPLLTGFLLTGQKIKEKMNENKKLSHRDNLEENFSVLGESFLQK